MSKLTKSKLSGHRDSVLCLDVLHKNHHHQSSSSNNLLVSGSEDGTARLWDLRTCRTCSCIVPLFQDNNQFAVTSVIFGPNTNTNNSNNDYCVYLAAGNHVHVYDSRKLNESLITRASPSFDLSPILSHEDEINQLSISKPRSRSANLILASADDHGDVRLIDTASFQRNLNHSNHCTRRVGPPKVLRHYSKLSHDNKNNQMTSSSSMVLSAVFRPKSATQIITGGTDCTLRLWDITRPHRPLFTTQIHPETTSINQMVNPPMIHSISWSQSGILFAAGLGDGSVGLFTTTTNSSPSFVELCRLTEAHTSAVCNVQFLYNTSSSNFSKSSSMSMNVHDRTLFTAGTDGNLFIWDLGESIAGDGALNPLEIFHFEEQDSSSAATGTPTPDDDVTSSSARIVCGLRHELKPNFMTSNQPETIDEPFNLFVGDTSNDITVYNIPR